MKTHTLIILTFLLFPLHGFAATYYVDGTLGNNANNGTTLNTAWKTLEYAESKVIAGDTVHINNGTYVVNPFLQLSHAGTEGNPITFQAINPKEVRIISTVTRNASAKVVNIDASYRAFKGIIFDGGLTTGLFRLNAVLDSATNTLRGITFDNSVFVNAQYGLNCAGCESITHSAGYNNTTADVDIRDSAIGLIGRTVDEFTFSTTTGVKYGVRVQGNNVIVKNLYVPNYVHANAVIGLYGSNNHLSNAEFKGSGRAAVEVRKFFTQNANNNIIENIKVTTTAPGGYGIVVGADDTSLGLDADNNIVRNVQVLSENATSVHGIIFGGNSNNILENSYVSNAGYSFVDKGTFGTIARNNIFNDTSTNSASLYPKGATDALYVHNVIRKVTGNFSTIYFGDDRAPDYASTGIVFKNNVIVSEGDNYALRTSTSNLPAGHSFTSDNAFYYDTGNKGLINHASTTYPFLADWQASVYAQDAHSLSGNPLFMNASQSFSTTTDFMLQEFSPAIDAGMFTIERTTDFLGNPIYGSPDIGPYEYQPPYTMSVESPALVGLNTGIRIYGNGKYRYTYASSTAVVHMSAVPVGGYESGSYAEYLNISNIVSSSTSTQWTASSSVATGVVFTVGDLLPETEYAVKVDGNSVLTATTDGTGVLTFTYEGVWSTHVFSVEKIEATNTATSTPTFIFTKDLQAGMTDPEVKTLQQYLNYKGVIVAASGVGSPGFETTYFNQATQKALVRFQKLNKITPLGVFGSVMREYVATH
ncbi:MAG: choice-of-anchor Q domain-containing protein [Patescibacteria group bacterium]